MVTPNKKPILIIPTVATGFYKGFNPVVAMSAKSLSFSLVLVLGLMPEGSARALIALKEMTIHIFAGWYIVLLAGFVLMSAVIVVLPVSRRIRLGPDGVTPEHSTWSWLSMMFCAGIGVGILVFSVSEPLSHFVHNPEILAGIITAGEPETVATAMRYVYLHWGLSAWGCYAVVGMALGLSCHRDGQPLTMRSGLSAIFPRGLERSTGHVIDILAIMAIITGITTTIILGLEKICAGLFALTGNPFFADQLGRAPLTALLTALVVAIAIAVGSISSGVNRGVKWMSQIGILLALGILIVFVVFGGGMQIFRIFVDATLSYFTTLPVQIFTIHDPALSPDSQAMRLWQEDWTIFYWAWWIAFAPFVGLFLARISKGRTLREFILGAILCPTAMCFVWFAGMGGSALLLEIEGVANGAILNVEHAYRIYATVDLIVPIAAAAVVKGTIVLLFLVLIVASSTAAIIAIKSIGAAGCDLSETPLHSMVWAVVIGAVAGSIIAIGGVESIRDVMIVGAVPFSIVMALMMISVILLVFRPPVTNSDSLQETVT